MNLKDKISVFSFEKQKKLKSLSHESSLLWSRDDSFNTAIVLGQPSYMPTYRSIWSYLSSRLAETLSCNGTINTNHSSKSAAEWLIKKKNRIKVTQSPDLNLIEIQVQVSKNASNVVWRTWVPLKEFETLIATRKMISSGFWSSLIRGSH